MKPTSLTLALAMSAALASLAQAGQETAAPAAPEANSFNFCEWLSSKPGTLYKDASNPYIQEFQISGRFHYNAAYVDRELINGDHTEDGYTEARRLRLGAKMVFAKYFTAYGVVNLVEDARNNASVSNDERKLDWGYQDFDEAYLRFDAGQAFDITELDKLTFTYGRIKWHGGLEARTSSNELLTVERSGITNYVYDSARPTGFVVNGVKGKWNVTAGIYSSDGREVDPDLGDSVANRGNTEFIGGWGDKLMYNTEVIYSATDDLRFGWEFLYNGADKETSKGLKGADNLLPYEWATTFSTEYTIGNGGINTEFFLGDNGEEYTYNPTGGAKSHKPNREGHFYGVTVTPYYWIVPTKLQAVVQYMYAGSENSEGVRTNSRYFRADSFPVATNVKGATGLNDGRGDAVQTVYAGLNYLICGDNLKLQAGVEYTSLDAPKGDASAVSYLFGFRSSF